MIFTLYMYFFQLWACNSPAYELGTAVTLEKQGQRAQAFDIYNDLISQYPNTEVAKQAEKHVQSLYLYHAKQIESTEPNKAKDLYTIMKQRWGDQDIGILATQKLAALEGAPTTIETIKSETSTETKDTQPSISDTIEADLLSKAVDSVDAQTCAGARASNSRLVWQQYKQQFPAGLCIHEAEQFLQTIEPRNTEKEQLKQLSENCNKRTTEICQNYRLFETLSTENICGNASVAIQKEMERLVRRKQKLLADNNTEYYEKFIPSRWDAIKKDVSGACADIQSFMQQSKKDGLDTEKLQESANSCAVCFVRFGNIADL